MPDPTLHVRDTRPPTSARSIARATLLAALALAAACTAGSGEGLDIGGRPLGDGDAVPPGPTLEALQANLFNPFCITCHAGAAAPLGLRLDAGNSFNNLVGVQSRQTGLLRVEPGKPENSYLIRKLEGTASEGGRMPLGGPPLPQSTIDFARQWITDGALPDNGEPTGGPPVVTSLDPAPGSVLSALPQSIDVGFDREIDASTINSETFTLMASGGDNSFGDGNETVVTPVSVSLSMVNPRLATMYLSGVSGSEDQYRVTLRGSGASFVMSVDGLALDGEFGGAFPSGDGTEGGDFVAGFSIEGLQPTLDSIQANVFGSTCALSGCHDGGGTGLPRGMDLSSADASFDALVGVDSLQVPGLPRVTPNDADSSYLVDELEGNQAAGTARMPQVGPFLDQATIDVIRTWIDDGAAR
jgi:hypothetical protein